MTSIKTYITAPASVTANKATVNARRAVRVAYDACRSHYSIPPKKVSNRSDTKIYR